MPIHPSLVTEADPRGDLRRCAICGAEAAKRNIHRNRYGEHICRECRRTGVRFSRGKRLRRWLKSLVRPAAIVLAWAGIALVIAKLVVVVLQGSTN